jgi:hypothetical protein
MFQKNGEKSLWSESRDFLQAANDSFNKYGKTNATESHNVGFVVSSHPALGSDKIIYFSIHTDSAKR